MLRWQAAKADVVACHGAFPVHARLLLSLYARCTVVLPEEFPACVLWIAYTCTSPSQCALVLMSVMAAALERMGMGIIPIMLMNRNGTVPVYARTPHVKFVLDLTAYLLVLRCLCHITVFRELGTFQIGKSCY